MYSQSSSPLRKRSAPTPRQVDRQRIVQLLGCLDSERAEWRARHASFSGREKVRTLCIVRHLLEKTDLSKDAILGAVGLSDKTLKKWLNEVEAARSEDCTKGVWLPDSARGNRSNHK